MYFMGSQFIRPIDSTVQLIGLFIVGIPLLAIATFLVVGPGQIRRTPDGIAYRRWFRWRVFPRTDVESIFNVGFSIGALKIIGRPQRLFFYIEPENEQLLTEWRNGSEEPSGRRARRRLTGHLLAAIGGLISGALIAPVIQIGGVTLPMILGVMVIAVLIIVLKDQRFRTFAPTLATFAIGAIAGALWTRAF